MIRLEARGVLLALVLLAGACSPASAGPASPAATGKAFPALEVPAALARPLPASSPACPRDEPIAFAMEPITTDEVVAPPGDACAPALAASGHCEPMSQAGMPSPRTMPHIVWTGDRVLVWAGKAGFNQPSQSLADGASFNVAANAWTPISTRDAAPPADDMGSANSVWSGKELIVWPSDRGWNPIDVFAYDPVKDRWRKAGQSVPPEVSWGGRFFTFYEIFKGGRKPSNVYDPATGKQRDLPPSPLASRADHAVIAIDDYLVVWGGNTHGTTDLGDGARFGFASGTWQMLPAAGAPSARHGAHVAWDGEHVLVWGGAHGAARLPDSDGAAYDPKTNSWSPLPAHDPLTVPAGAIVDDGSRRTPSLGPAIIPARLGPSIAGTTPIGWQAAHPFDVKDGGAGVCPAAIMVIGFAKDELLVLVGQGLWRYRPATGAWTALPLFPTPRLDVNYVWTGDVLVAWGGWSEARTARTRECRSSDDVNETETCKVIEITRYSDGVIYKP